MKNITKQQYDKYTKLRTAGIINMNNISTGSKSIGESKEVYETILSNYSELKAKFYSMADGTNVAEGPLELLKRIQTIFPNVEYLAEDEDGECYIFESKPIIGLGCWVVVGKVDHNFLVSPALSNVLVWEHAHWSDRIITTVE